PRCITSPGLGTLEPADSRGCQMPTQPQPARGVAPLPRQAPGAETPPPEPAGGEPTPGSKPPPDPEQAPPQHAAQPLPRHSIKRTRTSGVWVAVGFFAVILLL